MSDDQKMPCPAEHQKFASEWHTDGKLCDEWLRNLERGRFAHSRCGIIRRMVMMDQIMHFNRFDRGELIRLDVSLSQTLPLKRGFLREISASLGKFRGKLKFADEHGGGEANG